MRKMILTLAALFALAGVSYSITVNPASNALADSAATGLTIIYRDASGDFASNIATLSSLVTGGVSSSGSVALTGGYVKPYPRTLAQIQAITPATGDLGGFVTCTNCAIAYSLCVATGATVQGFRLEGTANECK